MRSGNYNKCRSNPSRMQKSGTDVDREPGALDRSIELMAHRGHRRDRTREPRTITTRPNEEIAFRAAIEHDLVA